MSFGDSSRLKLLKAMDITVIGGQNTTVTVNWGYDYTGSYRKRTFVVKNAEVSEFNVAEYNVATSVFSASIIIDREKIQTSGNGAVVTVGVDVTVNGVPFSVQEINIQALLGRMI